MRNTVNVSTAVINLAKEGVRMYDARKPLASEEFVSKINVIIDRLYLVPKKMIIYVSIIVIIYTNEKTIFLISLLYSLIQHIKQSIYAAKNTAGKANIP